MSHIKGRTAGVNQRLQDMQSHVDKIHGEHVEKQVTKINQQVESGNISQDIGHYLKSNIPKKAAALNRVNPSLEI